jgi:hypothetical protein
VSIQSTVTRLRSSRMGEAGKADGSTGASAPEGA